MRILIEGTRGKSGIVKMIVDSLEARGKSAVGKITGLESAIFYKGKKKLIKRKNKRFLIDKENKSVLKEYKKTDFQIFENQALSAYTMKAFHLVFKPDVILIPNIRFEHQDRLGETIEDQAKSFAINFKDVKKVITTERKKSVLEIFRKHCKKYKVELLEIKKKETIPGTQSLYLTDELIKLIFGCGLTKSEKEKSLEEIKSRMEISYDKNKKVHFFKGSKVNDVESTQNVYKYLKKSTRKNFCFVCYFRKDRPERTHAFAPFLKSIVKEKKVDSVFACGKYLSQLGKHEKIIKITEKDDERIFQYCRKNNLVMFTAVNGVNPFMQNIELNLQAAKK